MRAHLAWGFLVVFAVSCGNGGKSTSTSTSTSGAGGGASSGAPPPFADTTGEAANQRAAYPAGPYGIGVGSVIQNFDFVGYPDAKLDKTTLKPIQLADFYNPHGKDASYQPPAGGVDDRLFPADSGFALAGKQKPTVLLIDIASVWCGPCNAEAGGVLPMKHALYAPCGGEFLLQLADSATPGTAATQKNLTNWTTQYHVDYPGVIDPEYKLNPLYVINAFPENLIIDTTTMKIVDVRAGEVVPNQCDAVGAACTTDTDCQTCTSNFCGDGSMCTTATDCASKKCMPSPFWTEYEGLLDKTRPGCTVK